MNKKLNKLAREIVEELVDCDAADEEPVQQYLAWTEKKLQSAMRDNGDDELWEAMAFRLKTLEARLVTPVIISPDSDPQREHFGCSVRTTDGGTFYIARLGSVPGREMALYRNEAEALFIGLRDALSNDAQSSHRNEDVNAGWMQKLPPGKAE
nr:hypothetical protein [uncultured Serratia sp.]